jgi:mannose-6-phosphate isomerase-like protein (cupin superfamily)
MTKAVDIAAELARLPVLHDRRATTPKSEADSAFATIAPFRGEGVTVGSFDGESAWERHRNGDEIVQIIAGETTLTILTDAGREVLELKAGMLTVVPQGCWHRFRSPKGVSVLTVTPPPTDESSAEDPR